MRLRAVSFPGCHAAADHRLAPIVLLGSRMEVVGPDAGRVVAVVEDQQPCVRPDHLHPGTQQDNRREAMVRRRVATGERHGSQTHPEALRRGEQHGMAKLTAERVVEIRARYVRYKRGGDTLKALAKEFGVTGVTIARVVKGETWKVV